MYKNVIKYIEINKFIKLYYSTVWFDYMRRGSGILVIPWEDKPSSLRSYLQEGKAKLLIYGIN